MSEQNKRNAASMILAVLVIVAFGLYMVAFEVPFTHTAVVTRFGQVMKTYSGLKPEEVGLRFKYPWPIEQVILFDNRVRIYESKLEQLFTSDEQSITVTIYTAWRIGADKDDVLRFLKVVNTPENAESKLSGMAHDAMGKVVGRSAFESFVSTDPARMKFSQIEEELSERIKEQAKGTYGIEVLTVGIKRLELPEEATKKVFDRMRQEREQLAKKYKAEGEGQARQIRAQANRIASDLENRARAEAIAITGEGDVAAAKYYKIFAENPDLHNFIKRLETLKEILPRRSTLILDAERVPPFDLLSAKSLKTLAEPNQPSAK
ncbi:MAG: protease modulator HflC [Phycisphaerae bacterium]